MPQAQSSEAASELLAEKDAEIQRLRAELDEAKKGSDDAPAVLGREALTRMKESFEMVDTEREGRETDDSRSLVERPGISSLILISFGVMPW